MANFDSFIKIDEKSGISVNLSEISPMLRFEAEKFFKKKLGQIKKYAQLNLVKNKSIDTGLLRDSLEVKVTPYTSVVWGGVGIDKSLRSKKKRGGEHIPYKIAHLVERGFTHFPRGIRSRGKKLNGKPFLKPAVNQVGGDIGIQRELTDLVKTKIEDLNK